MIRIQIGDANYIRKPGDPTSSNQRKEEEQYWEDIAIGKTLKEAVENLVIAANDDKFSLETNWLRVIEE